MVLCHLRNVKLETYLIKNLSVWLGQEPSCNNNGVLMSQQHPAGTPAFGCKTNDGSCRRCR